MKQEERFLKPTPTIDSDHVRIRQKAVDLTEGRKNVVEKAKSLFYWVRDEIKYTPVVTMDILEDYRASKTYVRGKGFCVEKAALLAALSRAVGIPARLHLADIRNYLVSDRLMEVMKTNLFSCHGYCELFMDGKWVKATPAFDLAMCQENRIQPVEFDGREDAVFHPRNIDGKPHIEYVKDRGYYEDVPVKTILSAWAEVYGPEATDRLTQYLKDEKSVALER